MSKILIFAYNVDSSFWAKGQDYIFSKLRLNKNSCHLRHLTFGLFSMKKPWRKFLQFLPYQKEFLYRNNFNQAYPIFKNVPLPAIFIKQNGDLKLLVGPEEIAGQNNLSTLKKILKNKLLTLGSIK